MNKDKTQFAHHDAVFKASGKGVLMIEWVKKQYVSIILVALFCMFAWVRVKTLHHERGPSVSPQANSPTEQPTNQPGDTPAKPLAEGKKESCVGPSCGATIQTNSQGQPISGKANTTISTDSVSPLAGKEKACDAKSNEDCIELAELKESQGDKAAALKLYQKACRPPDVDIEACGDAGRLLSSDEADQARKDCEKGQLHMCLSVAGYYYEKNDKSQAKQLYNYGCKKGLSEACMNIGYLMSDEEVKVSKDKCKEGSASDCLYVAGQGSFQEKYSQQSEYLLKACELGDQTSCLRGADAVSDDKVAALNKECLWDGKLTACLLSIGKNSADSQEGKDPDLQKRLISRACELGNKTACKSMEK